MSFLRADTFSLNNYGNASLLFDFFHLAMDHSLVVNVNFKIISLNARGIRDFTKRKTIFNWLHKQNADIAFLQETYSTPDIVESWRFQWAGKMFFSHGTNHSRGVLILISDKLQFQLKNTRSDSDGRYVLTDALIQDSPFSLLNIYAPNITSQQCSFSTMLSILDDIDSTFSSQLIIGGDFNAHLDAELDRCGGRVEKSTQ